MVAFIDEHREEHGVEPICEVLPSAPSTCYEHVRRRREPERQPYRVKRNDRPRVEARRVHRESHDGCCGAGLAHHSDRGSQDLAIRYTERLAESAVEWPVSTVGDSYDNALAGSFSG